MRALVCCVVAAIAGCRPSATVENTIPVANLQSYRTVALHVKAADAAAQGLAMSLETAVLDKLHKSCGFENASAGEARPADVVLDLNITKIGRGGTGWLSNMNKLTLDTLLVLTDGQNGEILGTARIHGKSSGMIINNQPPETEAIEIVAKTVADMLAKSGCSGPRIASSEPPAQPAGPLQPAAGSGSAAPSDAQRAAAEALNEQGKEKLRSADLAAALAAFQQANALVPDARYQYNVCLAYETQEQWDQAIAACRQARTMTTLPKLIAKIDHRLELLQHHQ